MLARDLYRILVEQIANSEGELYPFWYIMTLRQSIMSKMAVAFVKASVNLQGYGCGNYVGSGPGSTAFQVHALTKTFVFL